MSLAPFAALEQRLNRAVLQRLPDAIAVIGGEDVPVLFQNPFAAPFGGAVDASAPECLGPVAKLGTLERGSSIVIDGVQYEVMRAEPNGAGLVRLLLASL